MKDGAPDVAAAAKRSGLSEGAAQALFDALVAGGGHQAQFSHPELGGMGQWSGGMTQIGDMFNDALKAKIGGFCRDMSAVAAGARENRTSAPAGRSASPWARPGNAEWWPADLGAPSSSGSQNDMSYACFPDKHRLAISRNGQVTLYDTGDQRLSSFSQQQPGSGELSFTGQNGPVPLGHLKVVES